MLISRTIHVCAKEYLKKNIKGHFKKSKILSWSNQLKFKVAILFLHIGYDRCFHVSTSLGYWH